MIAAALLSASAPSLKSTSTVTTTASAMKMTEQQVRTLIPVTTSDGSKLFVSGPCIVLKTQTPAPTVAQQMQALRPLLKADTNTNIAVTQEKGKKANDRNNNSNTSLCSTSSKKTESNVENEPEPLRCKRRIDFSSLGLPRPQPAAMARRNERERNRVKQVNMGFETLRQHVPQGRKNKKLSKVDTLKEAVKYIKYLHDLLQEADEDSDPSLTAAISDTITMVSRSSSVTTTASVDSTSTMPETETKYTPLPIPTHTDFMQLTTPESTDASTSMDFACEPPNCSASVSDHSSALGVDVRVSADCHSNFDSVTDMAEVSGFRNVPPAVGSDNTDMDGQSPAHLVELAPAQPNFLLHKLSSGQNCDRFQVTMDPASSATDLPVRAPRSSTLSSAVPHHSMITAMNLATISTATPTASPDYLTEDLNPFHDYSSLQSLRMEQSCRGSDGSCPVSPSESGSRESEGPEDCLGVSEGEAWQDLSVDIAEWLCSKIDIDDPDVFV